MADESKISLTSSPYTKEAEYLKAVDTLIEKLELALDNDMDIKTYKLRELINDVKYRKNVMLRKD